MTVLVTGASGFVGTRLTEVLAADHDVVCMSRSAPDVDADVACERGAFHSFEDLRALDDYDLDAAIHLAAVTGGCSERAGMRVNVEGTRRLLRYLIDAGVTRVALASSIGLVGTRSPAFLPRELPIPDDHPCLARNPYGVSKHLMEEVADYVARAHDDAELVALRLGSVFDEADPPDPVEARDLVGPDGDLREWAWTHLGPVGLGDAVEAFRRSIERPVPAGLTRLNAVGPDSGTVETVPELLRAWYPDRDPVVDYSAYLEAGHERDPVFAIDELPSTLGVTPSASLLGD